jgi:hypothetical protein
LGFNARSSILAALTLTEGVISLLARCQRIAEPRFAKKTVFLCLFSGG